MFSQLFARVLVSLGRLSAFCPLLAFASLSSVSRLTFPLLCILFSSLLPMQPRIVILKDGTDTSQGTSRRKRASEQLLPSAAAAAVLIPLLSALFSSVSPRQGPADQQHQCMRGSDGDPQDHAWTARSEPIPSSSERSKNGHEGGCCNSRRDRGSVSQGTEREESAANTSCLCGARTLARARCIHRQRPPHPLRCAHSAFAVSLGLQAWIS